MVWQKGTNFLTSFDTYFTTIEAPEQFKSRCFCSCLSKGAAKWLSYNPTLRELSWQELKVAFQKQFCSEGYTRTALHQLIELKHTGDLRKHIQKCRELFARLRSPLQDCCRQRRRNCCGWNGFWQKRSSVSLRPSRLLQTLFVCRGAGCRTRIGRSRASSLLVHPAQGKLR